MGSGVEVKLQATLSQNDVPGAIVGGAHDPKRVSGRRYASSTPLAGRGRCGPGVGALRVPVDPQQVRVTTEEAHDDVPLGGGDVQVAVGQAPVQVDHGARTALQDRDPVEQGLQLSIGHV